MSNIRIIADASQLPNPQRSKRWTEVAYFKSKNREISKHNAQHKIIAKYQYKVSEIQRALSIILAIVTFGGALLNKNTRNSCLKGKLHIRFAVPKNAVPHASSHGPCLKHHGRNLQYSPSMPSHRTASLDYDKEIELASRLNKPIGRNGWNQGIGSDEEEQTFDHFTRTGKLEDENKVDELKIVQFGDLSASDRKLIRIAADYLLAVHGIQTTVEGQPGQITCNPTNRRVVGHQVQYAIETQLSDLVSVRQPNTYLLGITNDDIYPSTCAGINFIFGVGHPTLGAGFLSTNRLGECQQTKLKRLLKLISHEFGHMRGILHCTKYSCVMQGVNSLQEMDRAPLIFCAQDMAKISQLNKISVKTSYQNQLKFFQNFFRNYHMQIDFSDEINQLRQRIALLEE